MEPVRMSKHDKKKTKRDGADAASGPASAAADATTGETGSDKTIPTKQISRREYERKLADLQIELVKLQYWIKHRKSKVVILCEGRDAAGKGGVIKRITECLNPRICRVVALPAPTDREQKQWYFQRYVAHLPAGGEIVIFDRSWYNRAGVEKVMGFCTEPEYREFFGRARNSSECWSAPASS
jgi:polyphosphate kinase 2 (PPK2 family)